MENFKKEVLEGLSKTPKSLPSKYFYDDKGSRIFQEIMDMPEYYLPKAESEIIQIHSLAIAQKIKSQELDIIELGAGDGRKIAYFLKAVRKFVPCLTYIPLDISKGILEENDRLISREVPEVKIEPRWGDYFLSLPKIRERARPRVIIFAGSNIGNYRKEQAEVFMKFIEGELKPGDYFILGVDLKKNPKKILSAYNDSSGITKRFNLNLLKRINRELRADFEIEQFDHYASYHPISGAAESFLVSLKKQEVKIEGKRFNFEKDEVIQTEISQKYDLPLLQELSMISGMTLDSSYLDSNALFSWVLLKK